MEFTWNRVKGEGINEAAQQNPAAPPKGNQFEALSATTEYTERMHISAAQQHCTSRETLPSMQGVKKEDGNGKEHRST